LRWTPKRQAVTAYRLATPYTRILKKARHPLPSAVRKWGQHTAIPFRAVTVAPMSRVMAL
ncbi:hypothetical protein, partial [Pseudoalteromonas luteoviolacea]|uniref:hypothetical protein n=1 Tax=Pseudoalteromonas luteoviolacea TaxID=43657 RepID=UPI001E2BB37D